jgi:putative aldouronate transport system permease protein
MSPIFSCWWLSTALLEESVKQACFKLAGRKFMKSRAQTSRIELFDVINLTLTTLLMIIILYPLIYIVSASFSDPSLVSTGKVWLIPRGINIEGYRRVFRDPEIMMGYRNTIFYTVAGSMINLFTTLLAAYALSRRDLVGKNVMMFLITFTMFFRGGIIPTFLLIKSLDLLDTWWVLLVNNAVVTYNLIIARTFFANGVPPDLEEASMIDGCSQAKTFLVIVLPLSKALIGVLALYYGVLHWNSWFSAMIYLQDRGKIPLQLILREILIEQQMKASMIDHADAMGEELLSIQVKLAALIRYCVIIVSSAPVIAIYPFLQRYFDKGVMLGSLKG